MQILNTQSSRDLESQMRSMASEIRVGITKYGIASHPLFSAMFARSMLTVMVARLVPPEVYRRNGLRLICCQDIKDYANLPSVLSVSTMKYVSPRAEVYINTRLFAFSDNNAYWAFGSVFNAIEGPHMGPTKAWPLASIGRVLTSEDVSG